MDGFLLGILDGFLLGILTGFLLGTLDGFLLGYFDSVLLGNTLKGTEVFFTILGAGLVGAGCICTGFTGISFMTSFIGTGFKSGCRREGFATSSEGAGLESGRTGLTAGRTGLTTGLIGAGFTTGAVGT